MLHKQKVYIPVYKGMLVVVVGEFEEVWKEYNLSDDPNIYDALVWVKTDKEGLITYYVAFRATNPRANVVAHEAVHLVNRVFRDRGVQLDVWNDEPQAYLTDWMVENIIGALAVIKVKQDKSKK